MVATTFEPEFLDEVLATEFACAALDEELTVKEYLCRLLLTLWRAADRFSGAQPFGASGWRLDIAKGLIEAGLIEGTVGEDGNLVGNLPNDYDALVVACIERMAV